MGLLRAGESFIISEAAAGRVVAIDREGARRVIVSGLNHPEGLALLADGRLAVGGTFTTFNGVARNRFALEVTRACIKAIGADRVGMRISPYGVFNGTGAFPDMDTQYLSLVTELSVLDVLYVHLVDHSSMGAPAVPAPFKHTLRKAFTGAFIASGGMNRERAEAVLDEPVLERVKRDDRDASARRQQRQHRVEKPLELAELVVDRDAQRLERAPHRHLDLGFCHVGVRRRQSGAHDALELSLIHI